MYWGGPGQARQKEGLPGGGPGVRRLSLWTRVQVAWVGTRFRCLPVM